MKGEERRCLGHAKDGRGLKWVKERQGEMRGGQCLDRGRGVLGCVQEESGKGSEGVAGGGRI